jgi:hypothetical protein
VRPGRWTGSIGGINSHLKMMPGPQGGWWRPLGGQIKEEGEKAIPGLAGLQSSGAGRPK